MDLNLKIKEDWLLPKFLGLFSDPDVYQVALSTRWTTVCAYITEDCSKTSMQPEQGPEAELEFRGGKRKNFCKQCGTSETSLWRRLDGNILCNACSLYQKLHGIPRPIHLVKQEIKKRKRRSKKENPLHVH